MNDLIQKELKEIKRWVCFPKRNRLLNLYSIERTAGVAKDSLRRFIHGDRLTIPKESIIKICSVLELIGYVPMYKIDLYTIGKIVCRDYKITEETLNKKTTKRKSVEPRQVCIFFAKELTKHTEKVIANHFGGKTPATIHHSWITVQNMINTNKQFAIRIKQIENRILTKFDL
jgi:chromosomal replication initiation ATPase DnaA